MSETPPSSPVLLEVSRSAIQSWAALPEGAPLALFITRADLDNLLVAIRQMQFAHLDLSFSFAAYLNNESEKVDAEYRKSIDKSVDSINKLVLFIDAVMVSARPVSDDNG